MRRGQDRPRAAVGFTVKSGWASAVLLTGTAPSPRVVDSRNIDLSDPAKPECRQPYHAGFGTARSAGKELSRLVASVERFGQRSVTAAIHDYESAGYQLLGAGLVVGSLTDPERIANDHIRIHALEGRLFRSVIQAAAASHSMPCSIWRDRDLYAFAAEKLQQPEAALRTALSTFGRGVTGGWRAEQKGATLAAWLVLAG